MTISNIKNSRRAHESVDFDNMMMEIPDKKSTHSNLMSSGSGAIPSIKNASAKKGKLMIE